MSREFLSDVLEKFAQVTSIIVEASKIKEDLDKPTDANLKNILEKTKEQVENLIEHSNSVKTLFYKKYTQVSKNLTSLNNADDGKTSDQEENASDPNIVKLNGCVDDNGSEKPFIKLVDIKKLVEPRTLITKPENNKVCIDDSVVVITSSDEESSARNDKNAKSRNKSKPNTKNAYPPRLLSKRKAAQETVRKTRILVRMSSESESSDDVSTKNYKSRNAGNKNKRTNRFDATESESSSVEEVNMKNTKNKDKQKKREAVQKENSEEEGEKYKWKDDPKFKLKSYIKLYKIPCEKLKEICVKELETPEINKLTDAHSLKRKRQRSKSVSSCSSTDKTTKSKRKATSPSPKEQDPDATQDDLPGVNSNSPDHVDRDNLSKTVIEDSLIDLAAAAEAAAVAEASNADTENVANVNNLADVSNSDKEKPDDENKEAEKDSNKAPTSTDDKQENDKNENEEVEANSRAPNLLSELLDKEKKDDTKSENNSDEKETRPKRSFIQCVEDSESEEKEQEGSPEKPVTTNNLLSVSLSSSDSEVERGKSTKKKEDASTLITRLVKKRVKKAIVSDSDSDTKKGSDQDFKAPESGSSSSDSEKESDKDQQPKPRKRVKRVHDSSEEEAEKSTRKQIRGILSKDSLAETTKQAEAEEKERKSRILEKQKKYNKIYEKESKKNSRVEKIVLDFDEKNNKELLTVDERLVSKLKPHQASGVQFMWDACFESLERAKNKKGSGCVLAHCMGLGKTLQVIALSHTLLVESEETNVRKVLVVCPVNTVLNWVNEFKQWLPDEDDFEVFELVSAKQNYERQYHVKTWHTHGGVLIIGYDMFRNLSNPENKRLSKKIRTSFQEALVDPGPDLVICDEGHLLKNEKTNISIAMNRLRTLRRIVLTGTPLQNNLKEYFCMVQFIKPNLLGTYKEYLNRFVNPITNGQYTDSTPHDIQVMRKRSHVLHKMLDGIVQRRDYSVLQPYLPPKFEYVLFLSLSEVQIKLYQHYMDHFARGSMDGSNRTSFLFVDFQALQRICTHPRVLLDKSIEVKNARENRMTESEDDSEGSLKDFINDDDEDEASSTSSGSNSDVEETGGKSRASRKRVTRAAAAAAKENNEEDILEDTTPEKKEWWQEYCDGNELDVIGHSSKLFLLFEILKECEQIGDKILVFSQSLYSLNVIEYFIGKIHEATESGDTDSVGGYSGSWCLGLDYFRLDGSSSCDNRNTWCKTFNNPTNTRARLFLISTRAGGLGINLVAANRVIIFDVSWNPSHDIQSIYRVYRFGQTKPCYIYRFVTLGTMEMKVYERQVTKQAISKRVIDEQQIDRHYNQNDLAELYKFEPRPGDRPTPLVPKDVLLGELLQKYEDRVYKYHEHQSLLENKEEEGLNEEERKAAWEEFENEKKQRNTWGTSFVQAQNVQLALVNLIRKENPTYTDGQVKAMIPSLQLQLQEQVAKGDLNMYRKVQQEMQVIHALQTQKLREQYYQQQLMKALQQQQQLAGIKYPNPGSWPNALFMNTPQFPSTSQNHGIPLMNSQQRSKNPGEVIDLND